MRLRLQQKKHSILAWWDVELQVHNCRCRWGCCTIFFPFLLSFSFLTLHAHHYCLFLLIGTAVGIFKMQRNSDEGRGEVAQAFTLWVTRMRMELHLQQLPSYGSAAAASALGWVTHSQKLHLQLEHKFCRNSFYQSFSLAKSLDSCVVSSCLGFNRHLERNIKVNNPSHCSWFRIDNKQTTTKQQQKNSLERNIITE